MAGSTVTPEIRRAARAAFAGVHGGSLHAVVAHYDGASAIEAAVDLFRSLNIPRRNLSRYKSDLSGMSFGLRFENGHFGEVNPSTYVAPKVGRSFDWGDM